MKSVSVCVKDRIKFKSEEGVATFVSSYRVKLLMFEKPPGDLRRWHTENQTCFIHQQQDLHAQAILLN